MEKFISSFTEDIISQLAQDETGKRQYYRPVYSLHKWWARRPGALFRSILLATQKTSSNLFSLTEEGSISTNSEYFQDHNFEDVIIFDPFMGGGTTLVEANRMGAKVIGCDLNPVSYWVVRETLKQIDNERLEKYFNYLEETAGKKIKALYKTICSRCNCHGDSLYTFWFRFVICPYCGNKAHLYKRTMLNEGRSRNKPPSIENPATTFCPKCFHLNEWQGVGLCHCDSCNHAYDPQKGTYNNGYFDCQNCGHKNIQLVKLMRKGVILDQEVVAIEYLCEKCKKRLYKSPDKKDFERFDYLKNLFENNKENLIFPKNAILPGASSERWRVHNYKYYYQVFNYRQIIAFNYLFDEINSIQEEEYRNAFITIFSNSLEYNNMMTPYNYPHRKLHHLFNYHALPLTTTPVENSVWGVGKEGAGTFVNCYTRYANAKKYCGMPFDKYKDVEGKVQTIFSKKERIQGNFVDSFEDLIATPRGTWLLCGDSSSLPSIPNESVDFVITDPPYYDSIHYSELSNFFYVWLAKLIKHPCFSRVSVPTDAEAIVNSGMDKGSIEYQNLIMAVFRECERILKREGKLIFTFHHTKWAAWWTILNAIVGSGFLVVDTFPVLSEYRVNPHIRNKQSLDMDMVLICQKRILPFERLSKEPTDILERAASSISIGGLTPTDNKLFLHFMGELLKTASSNENGDLTYDWFEDTLTHFDLFVEKIKNGANSNGYKIQQYIQKRLLERNGKDV